MLKAPTFDELKDFTLKNYVKLLKYLSQIYKIVPFCEIPRDDIPYLILRHDIDLSLPAALKMAQIEKDLGIKSTYFVSFSSRSYNVLEGKNVSILKQISKLGYEVGLHYDISQYQSYGQNMKQTLKMEIQLLEHLLHRKVYHISRHGSWRRDPLAACKEYVNANHPHLRRDIFIHDSCRAWTLHSLFRLLNNPPKKAQLLIHPGNWQEDKLDREAFLDRHLQNLQRKNRAFSKRLKQNWLAYPEVVALTKERKSWRFNHQDCKSNSMTQSKLWPVLIYYCTIFSWYVINTSLGWWAHKMIAKIRDLSKYTRNSNVDTWSM